MATVRLELPPKLVDVFDGEADVRGAYGGRGSAKTRTFAKMTAVRAYMWAAAGREGLILCGREYMNSLDDSSMDEVKQTIRSEPWLEAAFDIGEKYIRTKDGRVKYAFAGLDRNIDSVKSKSRILLCWVDEAEPVSETAWSTLIPTLREEDSELWVTWNPKSKRSATHKRFRETKDQRTKIVELNYRDNPWFPDILERTRLKDKAERPDDYAHVWEGDFAKVFKGAYYAQLLLQAERQGRVSRVAPDPLIQGRCYWDIGGTGARADATSIWVTQFVGLEIRVLNYYEASGQTMGEHAYWLRENGYDRYLQVLPHDGGQHEKIERRTYETELKKAGFHVRVMGNVGEGAAMIRVNAVRKLFPSMWFNAETTQEGREALAAYHERYDEKRDIGLGPNHDWASHGADAFGQMALDYKPPMQNKRPPQPRIASFGGRAGY